MLRKRLYANVEDIKDADIMPQMNVLVGLLRFCLTVDAFDDVDVTNSDVKAIKHLLIMLS